LNLGRIPSSKAKNIKRGVWGDKDFKMKIMGCLRGTGLQDEDDGVFKRGEAPLPKENFPLSLIGEGD